MKTIKSKLIVLISIAVLAIVVLSTAAFIELGEGKLWLDEIGGNRLPSTESLLQMKLALTDGRRVLMEAAIWENDYAAQDKFADVIKRRKPSWDAYAKEVGDYEPLPQTPDEAKEWRSFKKEIAAYREEENRLADLVVMMSQNRDKERQKALFVAYYRTYEGMRPLYRAVAQRLSSLIEINADQAALTIKQSDAYAERARVVVAAVLLAAAAMVLALGFYVYRSTLRQLGGDPAQAADIVRQIATGDLRAQVVVASDDQSSLMANVKILIETMERLANRADAIGKGDFSVAVELLSEHDRLGRAINDMTRMLRAGREADERRNWLKDGASQLATALTGDLTTDQLADVAIGTLGRHLGAGRAVFFIHRRDSQQLELIGSYMYTERGRVGGHYALGEGAIGQVGREKKPIILSTAANDAPPIVTGTYAAAPRYTYTYPLLHEGELLGVIELASFARYDETQSEFLVNATATIASFLFVAEQREAIRKLLAVTEAAEREARATSEQLQEANARMEEQHQQLQQQTEELQQTNAQMEEQQQELQQQTEELQQTNAQMEEQQQQLEQQNRELSESRQAIDAKAKQLEAAGRYKSEFLANMSHELRTPLNSIILLSKMMATDEKQQVGGEALKWAQVIHRSGEDLLVLINDVLDLSKIESGRMSLEPKRVASETLRANIQELFEHLARDKGIELQVEDALQAEFVTDPGKLEQILKNLLANAVKFTREGTVRFRLSRRPGASLPICLEVSDTGIGIAPEKQAMVFEAFQQADGSTSREYGGTGLGLTISLRFAQLLGGTIELQSTPGQGSVFSLLLPETLATQRTAAPAPAPAAADRAGAGLLAVEDDRDALRDGDIAILLIDDDPVFGQNLAAINRRLGYKTLIATSGGDGLVMAKRYRPQGILLDLGLPDMDGSLVLHQLKSNQELAAIPVYIVSARDRDEALLDQGAVGFLQKPMDERGLAAAEAAMLAAAAVASGSAILVIENGCLSAADVERIIGAQRGPVISAVPTAPLAELLQQRPCRLAIVDLGEGSAAKALATAAALRAAKPGIELVFYGKRAPSSEEEASLRAYSDSIIVQAAQAERRLLENVERFLRAVPKAPPLAPPRAASQQLVGKTILVVDDDPRNLFVITAALERHGAAVSNAVNGLRALELLARQRADLVIMDIMMPEMDGYAAIAAMRQDPGLAQVPVLAITAKALLADRAKILAAGADDYLSKPVDYDALIAAASKWCAGRNSA